MNKLSDMGKKAEAAMRSAVKKVYADARKNGKRLAVWRDGKVVILKLKRENKC